MESFEKVRDFTLSSGIIIASFSDLTLGSFDSAFTATISSSLSSSCEF